MVVIVVGAVSIAVAVTVAKLQCCFIPARFFLHAGENPLFQQLL